MVAIVVRASVFAEICTWAKNSKNKHVVLLVTKAVIWRPLRLRRRPFAGSLWRVVCRHFLFVILSAVSPRVLVHLVGFVLVAHSPHAMPKQQIFSECVKDQFCAKYGYERLLTT